MATERDLAAQLPPAPPPRPGAREAGIGAALHRFDGHVFPAADPVRGWRLTGRPQLGTLAAAALVAAIGLPLWLSSEQTPMPPRTQTTAPVRPEAPATMADMAAEPAANKPSLTPPGIVAAPVPSALAAKPAPPVGSVANGSLSENASAAPPPPLAFAPPPPPPAAPAMAAAAEEANDMRDVVVTGSRVMGRATKAQQRRGRRPARQGDWNTCTIDDPRQDMDACRKAAPIGDGLARAWQGDLDGAIAAFDRAIAASPRNGAAWLNRGLAHAKNGDGARALADLDKAIRYAPDDPRGWFQRSLILRRAGKTARADADAARAAQLDPRYEELVD